MSCVTSGGLAYGINIYYGHVQHWNVSANTQEVARSGYQVNIVTVLVRMLSVVMLLLNISSRPSSNSILPDAVAGVVHSLPAFDNQWVESTGKKAALKLEKLDTDLKNYKSNSIKESIR